VGKFLFSFLNDRVYKPFLLLSAAILQFTGFVLLIAVENGKFTINANDWPLYLFPIIFGTGSGGAMSVHQIMMVWCFGLKQLGLIIGTQSFFSSFAGLLGNTLVAGLRDRTGTYLYSFMCIGIFTLISGLFALPCKDWETSLRYISKDSEVKATLLANIEEQPIDEQSTVTSKTVQD